MMKHLHHPVQGLSIVPSHTGVGPPTCGLNLVWTPPTLLPHLGRRRRHSRLAWESLAQQREGVYITGRAAPTAAVLTEAVSEHGGNTRAQANIKAHRLFLLGFLSFLRASERMAMTAVAVATAGEQQSEVGMTFELLKSDIWVLLPLRLKLLLFSFYQ